MRKGNWKRMRATSMRHAMKLCIQCAKDVHNLSVERIAELMGLESDSALYKWLATGRMPAIMITPFENACQCKYVTYYQAYSSNLLVLDMPTGRKAQHKELNDLSVFAHTVIGQLIRFFDDASTTEQEDLAQSVTVLIEDLAHQRGNIEKHQQPELNLGAES